MRPLITRSSPLVDENPVLGFAAATGNVPITYSIRITQIFIGYLLGFISRIPADIRW